MYCKLPDRAVIVPGMLPLSLLWDKSLQPETIPKQNRRWLGYDICYENITALHCSLWHRNAYSDLMESAAAKGGGGMDPEKSLLFSALRWVDPQGLDCVYRAQGHTQCNTRGNTVKTQSKNMRHVIRKNIANTHEKTRKVK